MTQTVHITLKKKVGLSSLIAATFILIIFAGIGGFFIFMMLREIIPSIKSNSWPSTTAVVESSTLEQNFKSEYKYKPHIRYRYEWNGTSYVSDKLGLKINSFKNYSIATRWVNAYQPGKTVPCYVNPQKPYEAVLKKGGSTSLLFFLPIPLIFIFIGCYSVWGLISGKRSRIKAVLNPTFSTDIFDRTKDVKSTHLWAYLGVTCISALISYYWILPAWEHAWESLSWPSTPCEILSSAVRIHHGSKSTSYRVDIDYQYTFNGKTYRSDEYQMDGGNSSSGYASSRKIISNYPPYSQSVCYVDPQQPNRAVLKPGFTIMHLFGIIPIFGLLFGIYGLVNAFTTHQNQQTIDGEYELTETRSPEMKCFLSLAISLGVILSGMMFSKSAWDEWQAGDQNIVLIIMALLFNGGAIVSIIISIKSILTLANPRPTLTLRQKKLILGQETTLEWKFSGKTDCLKSLYIFVELKEEMVVKSGRDTSTRHFSKPIMDIISTQNPQTIASGKTNFTLPATAMHSFDTAHHRVFWNLKLKAEIDRWPDVDDEYRLVVLPPSQPIVKTS